MKSGFPNHLRKAGFRSGVKETADCPRSSSEADARRRGGAHEPRGTWEQVCIPVMQSVRQFLPLELLTSFPPPWLLSLPARLSCSRWGRGGRAHFFCGRRHRGPSPPTGPSGGGCGRPWGTRGRLTQKTIQIGGLTTTSADGRKHRFAMNGSVGQRQAGGTEAA